MTDPTPDTSEPSAANPPRIKSFVRRTGRVTTGQAKALESVGPRVLLPYQSDTIDLIATNPMNPVTNGQNDSKFERIVFEIGFGMGEATAHIAALMPQTLFLGCEVHDPGVGALLKRIEENNLHNLRICAHDAFEVLTHMIAPASLDGVHIFFPDPWHKKRHNKRRLIQAPFVELLASRLKAGGYLHCATDWQPYAEQILAVLQADATLKNRSTRAGGYSDKPDYRPLTKFENRGIKLGHGVWDVVFERV